MSFKSILVHVEADTATEPRLKLAAALANDFDARLVGVAAELFEAPVAASVAGYVDGETMMAEARVVEDDLRQAEARFMAAARDVRAGSDWRCAVAMPADMLALHARAADLVVAGPHRKEPYAFHNRADPGDLVMLSGRPVLVAPLELTRLDASSVVVGWKDTREARRAMADAMPFLERATQVLVAEVCENRDEAACKDRLADVASLLAAHGVKASVRAVPFSGAPAAESLQQIADAQNAGLIVVGAYGHARVREWVFGGVTRALLAGGHRAVLFSH